jgi:hypothetical protein
MLFNNLLRIEAGYLKSNVIQQLIAQGLKLEILKIMLFNNLLIAQIEAGFKK